MIQSEQVFEQRRKKKTHWTKLCEGVAVELDDLITRDASSLVQPVDVLCDDE